MEVLRSKCMKKTVLVCALAFAFCAGIYASGSSDKDSKVHLTGYLIDKHCLDKKNPADDTVMCLKMAGCEGDGYGIAVEQSDGTFKFLKFDAAGHQKAREIVYSSGVEKLGKITVSGKIENDLFVIKTISENK